MDHSVSGFYLVLLTMLVSTPVFATKARLQALGEEMEGSFYINDNRNIFLNPAEAVAHKDLITFEVGAAQTTDADGESNAEGGFLLASGNLVWGAQLGRVTDFGHDYNTMNAQAALDRFSPSNTVDLFMGGGTDLKWGAQVTYSDRADDNFTAGAPGKAKARELGLGLGVSKGNSSVFLKYGVSGEIQTDGNGTDIDRSSPFDVGLSHQWNGYTFFAQYESVKYEIDQAGTVNDVGVTIWQVGAGRTWELNSQARLFGKLSYVNFNFAWDDYGGPESEDLKQHAPLVVGVEYDASSWLVLRGSIKQNVVINEQQVNNEKATIVSTTDVNAGVGLKFGDLRVDGVLGTSGGGFRHTNIRENGRFDSDNLMSRVSLTYLF